MSSIQNFAIRRCEREWRWEAFDLDGRVVASGAAESRAVAAACVIRVLTRAASAAAA